MMMTMTIVASPILLCSRQVLTLFVFFLFTQIPSRNRRSRRPRSSVVWARRQDGRQHQVLAPKGTQTSLPVQQVSYYSSCPSRRCTSGRVASGSGSRHGRTALLLTSGLGGDCRVGGSLGIRRCGLLVDSLGTVSSGRNLCSYSRTHGGISIGTIVDLRLWSSTDPCQCLSPNSAHRNVSKALFESPD